jgi:sugar O-acyltransferase (sialic acid O-acetyltransferase NeuD family)
MSSDVDIIGIYGASGFGSEIYPLVEAQYPGCEIFFIDDSFESPSFIGLSVESFEGFNSIVGKTKGFIVAIANSQVREVLTLKCLGAGLTELSVQAENIVKMTNVEIDDGYILAPFSCITSNIKIGKSFHANIYSYVAHDCVIGNYVTFAPSVKCNGNVHIEDHAYIGTGAIIKQGTPEKPIVIGQGAVVGMGAVVTKSVPPGVTVVGNPARPFNK